MEISNPVSNKAIPSSNISTFVVRRFPNGDNSTLLLTLLLGLIWQFFFSSFWLVVVHSHHFAAHLFPVWILALFGPMSSLIALKISALQITRMLLLSFASGTCTWAPLTLSLFSCNTPSFLPVCSLLSLRPCFHVLIIGSSVNHRLRFRLPESPQLS